MGSIGSGKSSVLQLVTKAPLKPIKLNGKYLIENQDPSAKIKIGHSIKLCTDIVNRL